MLRNNFPHHAVHYCDQEVFRQSQRDTKDLCFKILATDASDQEPNRFFLDAIEFPCSSMAVEDPRSWVVPS